MKTRNQVAKLRQEVHRSQGDQDVQAISRLMDELSAAAVGGNDAGQHMKLAEYFEPEHLTPPLKEYQ